MFKYAFAVTVCAISVMSLSPVAHADVSADGKMLLSIASVGVGAGLCGITVPPATAKRMQDAMTMYADKQQDFITQEQYDAILKDIAADMKANKTTICADMKDQGLDAIISQILK